MNDTKTYLRDCPNCGNPQIYSNKYSLDRAVKSCTECRSCIMRKRVYSYETRLKMSAASKRRPSGFAGHFHSKESIQKIKNNQPNRFGNNIPQARKLLMQKIAINRYKDPNEAKKTSESVKLAMRRPDVRKRHIDALHQSKWIRVKTDKGQSDILNKWNRLGFNFEPNYQIKTNTDLFYADGYDAKHNVVMEYDSKYHSRPSQREKDLVRQNKIIDILKPRKFWRYDAACGQVKNVLEEGN